MDIKAHPRQIYKRSILLESALFICTIRVHIQCNHTLLLICIYLNYMPDLQKQRVPMTNSDANYNSDKTSRRVVVLLNYRGV